MKRSERIRERSTRQLILVRLFKFELNIPIIKPMSMIYFVNTYLSPSHVNVCSGEIICDRRRQLCAESKTRINELRHGDMSSARHVTIDDCNKQISRCVTEAKSD